MKSIERLVVVGALVTMLAMASSAGVFGEAIRFGVKANRAMGLAIEGDRLYGVSGDDFFVFDVSCPLAPKLMGKTSGVGSARQVAVQNGMAYVTSREYGLWIVDATDPRAPRIRSRFDTCELATGVDIAGDVCFCGQRQNGVEFVDVRDPDRPAHIAMRKTNESQSVLYRDGYLYSGEWGGGRVTVFDVRDMRRIREVTRVELGGYGDGLSVGGKWLYASTGHHALHRTVAEAHGTGHGVDVFDISDPAAPRHVSRVDFEPFYVRGPDMWTSRVSGDTLFAADTLGGLYAVDIADPARPKRIGRWTVPDPKRSEWASACIGSVAVGKGAVYVAANGVGFFAVPSPRAVPTAREVGALPKNADFREEYPTDASAWSVWRPSVGGQCRSAAVLGDRVYAAFGAGGLWSVGIAGGGFAAASAVRAVDGEALDVRVFGGRLYTAEGPRGFGIYEPDGQGGLREVRRLKRISAVRHYAWWVHPFSEERVAFSDRHGYDLFDISGGKFRQMTWVGGCPGWDRFLSDAAVGGGRYAGHSVAGHWFQWIDLTDGRVSNRTRQTKTSLKCGTCRLSGDSVILSANGGYWLLRPNEAEGETAWRKRPLPSPFADRHAACGIPRSDGRLVAFTGRIEREVALYDFTDAENPRPLGGWKVSGNPDLAAFYRGRLIVPCGYQGLLMSR